MPAKRLSSKKSKSADRKAKRAARAAAEAEDAPPLWVFLYLLGGIAFMATVGCFYFVYGPKPPGKPFSKNATKNGDVVFVNDYVYESEAAQHPKHLLFMYAPWCGHCKQMKPELASASQILTSDGVTDAKLFAVDCQGGGTAVCGTHNVKSYPTIKWIEDGVGQDFDAARKARDIATFVHKKLDPSYTPPKIPVVQSWGKDDATEAGAVIFVGASNYEEMAAEHSKHLLFMYAPWCGHCKAFKPELSKASLKLEEHGTLEGKLFAADCTGAAAEICAKHEVKSYPTLKWIDGDKVEEYSGGNGAKGVLDFFRLKHNPKFKPAAIKFAA